MTQEAFRRKLAAILSADVAGYSRLMGEDEEATVRTLTSHRERLSALIQKNHGRVVDSPGDNILAEFSSVVDAVRCAVEIQEELKRCNADIEENRRMRFRVGINLGDVIAEGDRIYGDGVNIAARLESMAEADGICISGTAYDQVKNKIPVGYEFLGEHEVKNIAEPVRAYRVLMVPEAEHRVIGSVDSKPKHWRWVTLTIAVACLAAAGALAVRDFLLRPPSPVVDSASGTKSALPLPDKPSIAVLPFVNMSDDPKQEYFSDGMTEDLITDLSKISGLFVIARNSVFSYKGMVVDVKRISLELGVRYVLEGSVRRAENKVRINAQLIDATTGGHLWAERYDGYLEDVFSLQDDVTQKIVEALAVKLTKGEQSRIARKYTNNLEAYDYFLQGQEYYWRFSEEANQKAKEMFAKAIELDPGFARAHIKLGWAYFMDWSLGWSQNSQSLDRAFELAKTATSLDDSVPEGHCLIAAVYLWQKKHDEAIAMFERVIALNPNYAEGYATLGDILAWSGRPEEAISAVSKAMRLDPVFPDYYLWNLGHAYYVAMQNEMALKTFKELLAKRPSFVPAHIYSAACYSELGRDQEALNEVSIVKRRLPNISSEVWMQRLPYKDSRETERILDTLRKLGIQ